MQDRRIVSTPDAPAAIGPYSQAVVAGDLVFCSGQIAIDPATNQFAGGSIEAQTTRVLDNLTHVLEAAGSGLDQALRLTVFVKDLNDFAAFNEVYATYFAAEPPARSTVQVAKLPMDVMIEVDCIALIGQA